MSLIQLVKKVCLPQHDRLDQVKALSRELLKVTGEQNYGLGNPNWLPTTEVVVKGMPRSTEDILILIAILDTFPTYQRYEIQLKLETEVTRRNRPLEHRILLKDALRNRSILLGALECYHSREFYGNVLQRVARIIRGLRFYEYKPRPALRPERQRGYRDHGTLLPSHKVLPKHDYTLTEKQTSLEVDDSLAELLSTSEFHHILRHFSRGSISSTGRKSSQSRQDKEKGEKSFSTLDWD